jgi:predicted DNA-binding protein with PD1-like motif
MSKSIFWDVERAVVWAVESGEDLVEEIYRLAESEGVKSGVVLTGVGSLREVVLYNPKTDTWPMEIQVTEKHMPMELVSIVGAIGEIGGEELSPGEHHGGHLHASFSDRDGNVFGGIIRSGCKVHVLVQVVVLVLEET